MSKKLSKRLLAGCLSLVLAAGSVFSNVGTKTVQAADNNTSIEEDSAELYSYPMKLPSTTGKKIYIYSWDEDLKNHVDLILKKYPQYKKLVECVTLGVSGVSDEYTSKISEIMKSKKSADIICWDDSMLSYAYDQKYVVPVSKVGFKESWYTKNAYSYTVTRGTEGKSLTALSWYVCPGVYTYRTDIAKKTLGTSDPAKVHAKIKNWKSFFSTAATVRKKGYKILSGNDDIKYAVLNSSSKSIVKGSTIDLTGSVKTYLQYTQKLYDNDYTEDTTMWSSEWTQNMYKESNVLGYFGATWFRYTIPEDVGCKYAVCEGPSDYYWGGSYVTATNKSHNKELTKFILYELTCDTSIAESIYKNNGNVPNNQKVVANLLKKGYGKEDGITNNALKVYDTVAKKIKAVKIGKNDSAVMSKIESEIWDILYYDSDSIKEQLKYMKIRLRETLPKYKVKIK